MKTVRVSGVPEHFNYPWHYAINNGLFAKAGFDVQWSDVTGGSGAMCSMLEENQTDVALVLTEGIVKHIHKGGTTRIIQQYVKSPLIWGVHSSLHKKFNPSDLSTARIARSRVGSGSHLMAYVHAEQHNYKLTEENFVTVENINGALEAFKKNSADILLWEKFMTQPYVDNGDVSRIGMCISPWPCFMLVGSRSFIALPAEELERFTAVILAASKHISTLENTTSEIAKRYRLDSLEVEKWYDSVEWQTTASVSAKMLNNVVNTLERVGLLNTVPLPPEELCYAGIKLY
jgi:ABC-type nitrate/sulfonate/bicarbonate transport system substrate-binding protein